MKYRILYEVVEPLRARSFAGAVDAMYMRSDDIDEYALQGECLSATLQQQVEVTEESGDRARPDRVHKVWRTVKTIKA